MTNDQRLSLVKIANSVMADPTIGQSVGASWQSFKTGLKDAVNPKAWVANAMTGGNYTKDRQLASRQQYYAKAQQQVNKQIPQAGQVPQQPQQPHQPQQPMQQQ